MRCERRSLAVLLTPDGEILEFKKLDLKKPPQAGYQGGSIVVRGCIGRGVKCELHDGLICPEIGRGGTVR